MNGLEIIDEKTPGFTDKLLRREPRENAYVEINNLIASAPLEQVSKDDIDRILASHKISNERAKSRLSYIYTQVLTHFVQDFQLTDEEAASLASLQEALSIGPVEVGHIHASILYPIFQNAVRNALFDGRVTEEEEAWLRQVAKRLRIPDKFVEELYAVSIKPWVEARLKNMLADGQLSPDEEAELAGLSKNFNLNLKFDPSTLAVLHRARYLWRLAQGELPRVQVPVYLNPGEFCSVFVEASVQEIRDVTRSISKFSGTAYSNKNIFGQTYSSGRIETENITDHVLENVDRGMLYFTNQRLLFNGRMGNMEIDLRAIIGATFYSDGMLVERNTGVDKTFIFTTDIDAIRIIFDTLMTKARGDQGRN